MQPSYTGRGKYIHGAEKLIALKGQEFTGCKTLVSGWLCNKGTTSVGPIKPIKSVGL
jgi:hypothetical protein